MPDLCPLSYFKYEQVHEISNNVVSATSKASDQPANTRSLIRAFASRLSIGLKTLLQQGISEPIFYGGLVYKFKRIVWKPNFSDQFKKIV